MFHVQLRRLQYIHTHHFIHRDLKPSNIVMGTGSQTNLVYLIDFGLSKEYRDPNTRKHIPCNEGLGFIGTTTFASVNSHMGLELGRRDDLESLAYILFYFLWGFFTMAGPEKKGGHSEEQTHNHDAQVVLGPLGGVSHIFRTLLFPAF
jgi:serine/threonine protein kinase